MLRPFRHRRWAILLTLVAAVGVVLDVGPRAVEWALRTADRISDKARERNGRAAMHAMGIKPWEYYAAKCASGEWAVRAVPASAHWSARLGYFPGADTVYDVDDRYAEGRGYQGPPQPAALDPASAAALCRSQAAYHRAMERKWRWAARFPWTRVAPDPPGPPVIYDPGPRDSSY